MMTVLLVDDQPAVRRALQMRLALEADIRVVGEAGNGIEALALARVLHPDVVVMDVSMPRMDGIATASALHAELPQCAVVVLTLQTDPQTRERAFAAGAVAFLEKRGGLEPLLDVIRQLPQAHGHLV